MGCQPFFRGAPDLAGLWAMPMSLGEVWVSLPFPALPSVLCPLSLYHSETKAQNETHALTGSDNSEWGCEHVCSRSTWEHLMRVPGGSSMDPRTVGPSPSSRQDLKRSSQSHSTAMPGDSGTAKCRDRRHRETTRST